jgi:hypothetical protein
MATVKSFFLANGTVTNCRSLAHALDGADKKAFQGVPQAVAKHRDLTKRYWEE